MAWEPLGWQAAGFAEIQPFACALLEQRWPGVPVARWIGQRLAAAHAASSPASGGRA